MCIHLCSILGSLDIIHLVWSAYPRYFMYKDIDINSEDITSHFVVGKLLDFYNASDDFYDQSERRISMSIWCNFLGNRINIYSEVGVYNPTLNPLFEKFIDDKCRYWGDEFEYTVG